jgi:very-short-patch-repair endonuclease/Zn finger protein HypA/HybF involved in hydrogenase expression
MRIDTDEFIRRSKAIHGDKYDYSKSVFVSSKKPIDIICKKHNYKFTLKRAQAHLQGSFQGCPICSAEKIAQYNDERSKVAEEKRRKERKEKAKLQKERKPFVLSEKQKLEYRRQTQEKFLKKARAKYGDTYDYSLVEYQGREIPIKIICKTHGVFPISPRTFLQGRSKRPSHGCPKCDGIRINKKITQENFLNAVREKHGDKWDVSNVQYVNKKQILGLSCPDCKDNFETTTEKLMDGFGCPRCEGRIKDLRYFVEEAKKVHGDEYDYSECYLSHNKSGAIVLNNIRCKHHGLYSTRANVHIQQKCKCPKCYPPKDKIPLEERRDAYIRRAIKIHGEGRFDYSQVDYHRKRDKVKIRCIIHDYWFYQSLEEHTKKKSMGGCPLCSETTGEREVRLFLEKKKLEYTAQMEIENIRPDILKLQYMRVDFYVKKYRLIIEYNGEQHYKNCGWYKNSKRNLEMQQLRDEVLREYCQKFDFNLLEIKYSEFDNIGKLIDAKIKEIKANEKKGNSNYGTH